MEGLMQALSAQSQSELLELMHIDVWDTRGIDLHSGVAPAFVGPPHHLLQSGTGWGGNIMALWGIGEIEKESPHGPVLEITAPPLTNSSTTADWNSYTWPQVEWFDFSSIKADLLRYSNFSILASGGSIFQHASYLRGLDGQLFDLLADPDKANYLIDKLFEFYFHYYKKLFEKAGDLIDVFAIADDFGTQNSLLISPDLFRQFFSSRMKALADLAHHYDIYFLLHTCGDVEPLIPDFIEAGVDVLDPIQPESMDPAYIKKEYGQSICLRGGISSQQVLAHGSIRQVKEEVKRKLDILMPGGGYIFAPGHPVLQVDIPTENIITMYETAYEYGLY